MGLRLIAFTTALLAAGSASSTTLTYTATNLGGDSWRYDYTLGNDTLDGPLREVTVYFDLGVYANLAVVASPPEWNSLVVQPDAGLPDAGFFDSLAAAGGLAPGAVLPGFAVSFDYLGGGTPGSQLFEIVNPEPFGVIDGGNTAVVLPAPAAGWLLGTTWLAVGWRAGRRRRS